MTELKIKTILFYVLPSTDTPETCELADLARTKYTENSILKTLKHVNANYPVFGDKYQYKGSQLW